MSYPKRMEKLMRTESPEEWVAENITIACGLLKTSHLALENFDAGMFSDEEIRHAVTYSLEAALGLLSVAEEGVDVLERRARNEASNVPPEASLIDGHEADVDSSIAAMHREITSLQAVVSTPGTSEADCDAANDRLMELADKIVALPARNASDMLLKIMGTTVNGDHEIGDSPGAQEIWAEARRIVGA